MYLSLSSGGAGEGAQLLVLKLDHLLLAVHLQNKGHHQNHKRRASNPRSFSYRLYTATK